MENLFLLIFILFSIIIGYIFIKNEMYTKLYRNIKINNVKFQIILQNQADDVEVLVRKLMYINDEYNIFNEIEFIDNNSKDETYEILEKMAEKYNYIKVRKML